jgi:hypothetical protein
MKNSVAISLIKVGAVLVLSPFIYGLLYQAQLAQAVAGGQPRVPQVVSSGYQWFCALVGVAAIAAGAIRSYNTVTSNLPTGAD